jgi:predicted ABC-type ATPase
MRTKEASLVKRQIVQPGLEWVELWQEGAKLFVNDFRNGVMYDAKLFKSEQEANDYFQLILDKKQGKTTEDYHRDIGGHTEPDTPSNPANRADAGCYNDYDAKKKQPKTFPEEEGVSATVQFNDDGIDHEVQILSPTHPRRIKEPEEILDPKHPKRAVGRKTVVGSERLLCPKCQGRWHGPNEKGECPNCGWKAPEHQPSCPTCGKEEIKPSPSSGTNPLEDDEYMQGNDNADKAFGYPQDTHGQTIPRMKLKEPKKEAFKEAHDVHIGIVKPEAHRILIDELNKRGLNYTTPKSDLIIVNHIDYADLRTIMMKTPSMSCYVTHPDSEEKLNELTKFFSDPIVKDSKKIPFMGGEDDYDTGRIVRGILQQMNQAERRKGVWKSLGWKALGDVKKGDFRMMGHFGLFQRGDEFGQNKEWTGLFDKGVEFPEEPERKESFVEFVEDGIEHRVVLKEEAKYWYYKPGTAPKGAKVVGTTPHGYLKVTAVPGQSKPAGAEDEYPKEPAKKPDEEEPEKGKAPEAEFKRTTVMKPEEAVAKYHNPAKVQQAVKDAGRRVPKEKLRDFFAVQNEVSNGKDSKNAYFKDGKYTPERAALHDEIKKKILKDVPSSDTPVCVMFGGVGGSGKSTLAKDMRASGKFVYINADDVKSELPEYTEKGIGGAMYTHEESSDVADSIMEHCIKNRIPFILDATLKTGDRYKKIITEIKKLGFKTQIIATHIPTHEAIKRAVDRYERSGRYVPPEYIASSGPKVIGSINELKHLVDDYKIYDTDVPKGEPFKRIEKVDEMGDKPTDEPLSDAEVKTLVDSYEWMDDSQADHFLNVVTKLAKDKDGETPASEPAEVKKESDPQYRLYPVQAYDEDEAMARAQVMYNLRSSDIKGAFPSMPNVKGQQKYYVEVPYVYGRDEKSKESKTPANIPNDGGQEVGSPAPTGYVWVDSAAFETPEQAMNARARQRGSTSKIYRNEHGQYKFDVLVAKSNRESFKESADDVIFGFKSKDEAEKEAERQRKLGGRSASVVRRDDEYEVEIRYASESFKETWRCQGCGNLNWNKDKDCSKCGASVVMSKETSASRKSGAYGLKMQYGSKADALAQKKFGKGLNELDESQLDQLADELHSGGPFEETWPGNCGYCGHPEADHKDTGVAPRGPGTLGRVGRVMKCTKCDCEKNQYDESLRSAEPFAGYPDFNACVSAQKGKGLSEDSAKRVCATIHKKVTGEWPGAKEGKVVEVIEEDDGVQVNYQ